MPPAPKPALLNDLNREFERLHTAKEDAFWDVFMGLSADRDAARADFNRKEVALQDFLRDPARLVSARAALAAARAPSQAPDSVLVALEGWCQTLAAHCIEQPEARAEAASLLDAEGELAGARSRMALGYREPASAGSSGAFVPASSVKLGAMLLSDPQAARRRAAWEGLRSIETCVLEHGFLEIVKRRNRLGRSLGAEDYYDWTVQRGEGLSKRRIFAWLEEVEAATRQAGRRAVEWLAAEHGEPATPWNLRYWATGDLTREQDPYFPFSQALLRWGRSFAALGIDYQGATLVLDLIDRKGKHENGFMHGPVPAWRDDGQRRPARIQFTANAIPGLVGAGRRAAETLFHEGGHAAHFANIDMPAPCFAQEWAPSSVAFAETQSMFLDSLLADADWQARYATTRDGQPMPAELIERGIRARQPLAAWELRQRLSVCFGEKALYEIPEAELTPQRALEALREVEQRLLFLEEGSPRPILSVPHLISGESSAYYHGYVLAEMAVEQTRAFFLARDGRLTDNPKIGPTLREHYWQPGNSRSFEDFVAALTGAPLSARHLAGRVNRTADEAAAEARALLERSGHLGASSSRTAATPTTSARAAPAAVQLNASVQVRHGHEVIASTAGSSFEACAARFADWVEAQAQQAAATA
ncbi:MAG: M3 family metallopeptidase [Planctomycetota bacterium]